MYERNKQFINSVTRMGYHSSYSPQNFQDAYERILEMRKVVTRDTASDFVSYMESVQRELASHGFDERYGNRIFYNQLEEQIRYISGLYGL